MKILVLNCGSSSIKYKLFDMASGNVMAQGGIEKIGLPGAFLKLTDKEGKINRGLEILTNVFMKMVSIIMLYAPIGIVINYSCNTSG